MTTFAEQLEVLRTMSREALEGAWDYYSRTRDKSPTGYPKFRKARLDAEQTIERLAAIEEVVGYEATEAAIRALEERARQRKRERAAS
jgi:hypothetical protein